MGLCRLKCCSWWCLKHHLFYTVDCCCGLVRTRLSGIILSFSGFCCICGDVARALLQTVDTHGMCLSWSQWQWRDARLNHCRIQVIQKTLHCLQCLSLLVGNGFLGDLFYGRTRKGFRGSFFTKFKWWLTSLREAGTDGQATLHHSTL